MYNEYIVYDPVSGGTVQPPVRPLVLDTKYVASRDIIK